MTVIKRRIVLIDIENIPGFYTYVQNDFQNCFNVNWFIPENIHNNEIIRSQMRIEPFKKLIRHIGSIEAYNNKLSELHLDIEQKSIIKKKQEIKDECYQIIEEINKGLLPYHWEIQKDTQNRHDWYLIGLFTGENKMIKDIEKL